MTDTSANLDFLRATAVVLVCVFHVLLYFGFEYRTVGEFGVLLFFVHTTLVLMFSLERQQAAFPRRALFSTFMLRRIFRIYPLAILVVAVSYALSLPTANVASHQMVPAAQTRVSLVADLLLIQNLLSGVSNPGPLWSLPFEIQMYLFLPALFLLVKKQGLRGAVYVWVAVTIIASIKPYSLLMFAPCFLPGVIAFALWRRRSQLPWQVWPIVLLSIVAIYAVSATYTFAGPRWPEWLACLAVGASAPWFQEMPNNALRRVCGDIARYSFGIYLTHMAMLWLFFDRWHAPIPLQIGTFAVSLFGISALLFYVVESPFIRLGGMLLKAGVRVRAESQTPASMSAAQ